MSLSQWSARWLNDILPYAVKCRYDILPCARQFVKEVCIKFEYISKWVYYGVDQPSERLDVLNVDGEVELTWTSIILIFTHKTCTHCTEYIVHAMSYSCLIDSRYQIFWIMLIALFALHSLWHLLEWSVNVTQIKSNCSGNYNAFPCLRSKPSMMTLLCWLDEQQQKGALYIFIFSFIVSLILYFCTFPVTVRGNSFTNST